MPSPDNTPPEVEHQHHNYVGNSIPWYVRAIWIGFWIFGLVAGMLLIGLVRTPSERERQ